MEKADGYSVCCSGGCWIEGFQIIGVQSVSKILPVNTVRPLLKGILKNVIHSHNVQGCREGKLMI